MVNKLCPAGLCDFKQNKGRSKHYGRMVQLCLLKVYLKSLRNIAYIDRITI